MSTSASPDLRLPGSGKLKAFAIGSRARREIRRILPEGKTILELGSGAGTVFLAKFYKMISIESETGWIGMSDSAYLYAPIKDGWYDRAVMQTVADLQYDFLLIDGPWHRIAKRSAILSSIDLFDLTVPILVDDSNRPDERYLVDELARLTGRESRVFQDGKKQFTIV